MSTDPIGLADVARLVDIASPSHHESALADHVQAELARLGWLEVDRVGDNVVARTRLGRPSRLILAGHLDTVPANGNERAKIDGDVLWGLGSADMKGGLAVFLDLARTVPEPRFDLTFIFYVCEEVEQIHSGLLQIEHQRPDLLEADAAVLGEPTGGCIEAGCQGSLRARLTLGGVRAHTARPWMGVNAVHRLAPVLAAVAEFPLRQPVLDGCRYREALQAVRVEGGVANNVVPDRVSVVLNHRFAPDRDVDAAFAALREGLAAHLDDAAGDMLVLEDHSAPAPPGLGHPLLGELAALTGRPPRAKLGWTDVSFFAARGMAATNFGPGDPEVAHTADERLERSDLLGVHRVLLSLLAGR
ncbi:MAG TPA: succinyl-diaminopimelate desuccinylase [Acidimicrobiales bacterium]|nr:succinyl-diaminopimelate desuccinylase [Acidimicrobiales bacterium]